MNVITLGLVLLWLGAGVLVVSFVYRTGGTTVIGRIAHWFGGTFVMVVLGVGVLWTYAGLDENFGARVKTYLLTHQFEIGQTQPMFERAPDGDTFVMYRPGRVTTGTTFAGPEVVVDETKTIRTSWWWMLWDTQFER